MQTTLFLLIFAAKRKQTQKYDNTCKQHTPYYPPRAYCVRGGLSYAGDADSKTDDNGNNKALPHQKAILFDGEGLI